MPVFFLGLQHRSSFRVLGSRARTFVKQDDRHDVIMGPPVCLNENRAEARDNFDTLISC